MPERPDVRRLLDVASRICYIATALAARAVAAAPICLALLFAAFTRGMTMIQERTRAVHTLAPVDEASGTFGSGRRHVVSIFPVVENNGPFSKGMVLASSQTEGAPLFIRSSGGVVGLFFFFRIILVSLERVHAAIMPARLPSLRRRPHRARTVETR